MKEDLSFLNDIDIDENEIEEKELCEFTKNRIKKNVMKKVKKNKFKKKNLIAASICLFLIGATGVVGIANPVYAANIPVVGDIFRYIDSQSGHTGAYNKYKEYANEINVTKKSKGIEITIKDAVFEGNTIVYTYEIKTDEDLGINPAISGLYVKGEEFELGGESTANKVSDNYYVGKAICDYYNKDNKDYLQCKIKVNPISIFIEGKDYEEIKGDWEFDFSLNRVESTDQSVDKSVSSEGVKVNIDNIHYTPMSFTIKYTDKFDLEIVEKIIDNNLPVQEKLRKANKAICSINTTLNVKDDLGNIYKGVSNGAESNDELSEITFSENFGEINKSAKKLIITPKVTFEDKNDVFNKEDIKGKEIILDEIIVDIE